MSKEEEGKKKLAVQAPLPPTPPAQELRDDPWYIARRYMAGMLPESRPLGREEQVPPTAVPPASRLAAPIPSRPSTAAALGSKTPIPPTTPRPIGTPTAANARPPSKMVNRREFMRRLVATTVLVAVSATGAYEIVTKLGSQALQAPTILQQQQTTTTTPTAGSSATASSSSLVPVGYTFVTQLSSLGGKTSAYFTHPRYGSSILIDLNSQWKAFSAVCTHRPCTVDLSGSSLYCPCHGATFSTSNGAVLGGPAPTPLAEYGVQVLNGNVYVSTARIN